MIKDEKDFIEKSIEGGYQPHSKWRGLEYYEYKILLSPEAWAAVGKTENWVDDACANCGGKTAEECCCDDGTECPPIEEWHWHMRGMIDTLAQASQKPDFDMMKTIREYLRGL